MRLPACLLSLLLAIAPTSAVAGAKRLFPPAEFRGGGLNVTMTASRYQVVQPALPENPTGDLPGVIEPGTETNSIVASACVTNTSRAPVAFSFPNPVAAELKWTFRIFDGDENLVWTSDGNVVSPQVMTEATLEARQKWRRTARVPLVIDGVPLAPGTYHLEASIDADKKLGASTFFEVIAREAPPGALSGIRGQVLKSSLSAEGDPDFEPAAGAVVTIQQIGGEESPTTRRPLFWLLRADEEGRFSAPAPAGRYRVTAFVPPRPIGRATDPIFASNSVEVTVSAGQFSEVTIRLDRQFPPEGRGAIRGLLLIGPIHPVETPGNENERPLGGAFVVVEQLATADGQTPFRWTGRTNNLGRFELAAPAGRYVVIATGPEPRLLPAHARAEVVVEAGETTEVTLRLDSGIR